MRRLFYLFVALPLVFAACTEQPDDNPAQKEYKLVITSNKVMEFPAEGGEGQIEWEWQEVTRLSSAEPTLTTEAEWIACGQGSLFSVAKNEGEPREAVIRFELFGQVEEVVVKQSGVERAEGVVFEAQMLRGSYFGDEYSEDGNYYICLTDNGFEGEEDFLPNSTYYYVDLYGELFDGQSDGYVTLPLGEYVLDASNSSAAGTFSAEYSEWYKTGATDVEENEYYESGNLVVTAEGVTLTVVICGVQHTVTYSGSLAIVDARGAGNDVARHFAAEYAVANYMGDYYNPGVADNFTIVLSDLGLDENGWELPDASYYLFDLYTEVVDGELRIPHGTYSFDLYDTCLPNTIGASFTRYILMDQYANDYLEEIYFVEGTLTVDADGIVADLVAEDGTHHNVTFEGVVTNIADYSDEFGGGGGSDEILSTLWEDWYCNFSGCSMDYTWYGDYYDVGYDNWFLYLMPNGDVGDGLQLDLLSNDVGLYELSGEYVISNSLEKFTAYPGYANGDYMEGSWYFNADLTQYAPLVEGDIYITNNGDTTFTIEIDAYDDAGNNIYGSWTGVDPNQAQTFAAKRGAHHGLKNKSLSPAAKLMHKR
ncbi:MAG: BACON domain-containing protein [Alistipes sp.]|nr:BACON domain-containing protein [Alistipes sp.]